MFLFFREINLIFISNSRILWAIPIFWPILIARMFLSGKTYKPTMNEYDYEQFLKGNGK